MLYNSKKIAVLILSCDKYSELWNPLAKTYKENWPDCAFDIYLLTNYKTCNISIFKEMLIGNDISWSSNLLLAIEKLKTTYEYVLITLDDLFLTKKVNNENLDLIIKLYLELDANYLQFIKSPLKTKKNNKYFNEIIPGSIYRTTCVFALWKISILDKLILINENAWEFERKGAKRSSIYNDFYSTKKDLFIYRNTVVRGQIVLKDAKIFGLKNLSNLSVMGIGDYIRFRIRYYIFFILIKIIPLNIQKKLVVFKEWVKSYNFKSK